MKRYIQTNTLNGSYLVDRDGYLHEVILHAPSTTYINRGLLFLAPSDGSFLYEIGKISKEELEIIIEYNLAYYLDTEKDYRILPKIPADFHPSVIDLTSFDEWAELMYAKSARHIFMKLYPTLSTSLDPDIQSKFDAINDKWYPWLQDNFVKLSVINKIAEFRITSEDGYDWNDVIIDDVILSHDWRPGTRFNVLKEDAQGYKAYFFNATMDDILEDDSLILANENLIPCERVFADGQIYYENL